MEDIRPTAKWANRMLRPLKSIYYRLEKHREIFTTALISKAKEKADTAIDAEQTRQSAKGGTEHRCSYPDDEEPNDPAWIPGKPEKRRIRHNYSSRGRGNGARRRSRLLIRSPEVQRTLPGAIEIATPLITGKIRGTPVETSPSLRMQLFQNQLSNVDDKASAEHRKTGRINHSRFPAYHGSWKEVLDQSGDPGLVDIAHLLDRIFLKILKNTQASSTRSKGDGEGEGGARSLLSMAVRRLPEFIAEEQRIQDESDEGSEVDMCDAYFTELEASYAPKGNGWQPLREAVRAQGIYLVSCMIQKQWITPLAACRLLEECLFQEEFDAFESLQTIYLANVDAYHYPTVFDPPRPPGHRDDPVQILGTYYRQAPARRSYVFEELTRLLTRGAIPPEWMVTTMWKKCVDRAIKSVSTEDHDYAAARRLIEAVILSSAGIYSGTESKMPSLNQNQLQHLVRLRETRASTTKTLFLSNDRCSCPIPIQDALSNLIFSLLTALCGMCIARSQAADADERTAGLRTREMVNYLAVTVQRAVGNGSVIIASEEPIFHPMRRGYVLMADCTLFCGKSVTAEIIYHSEAVSRRNIELFFRTLASRQDVIRELAGLVSQVFHHSGHAQGRGPTHTPKEIRARVSQLAQLTSGTGVALLLGKVAAEAAMELAEKSLDPDDHTWAVEIQEKAALSQQGDNSPLSPSSSQLSSNDKAGLYRWEASIDEWVASTPASKPRAATVEVAVNQPVRRRVRPRIIACSTSSSSANSLCSENTISSVTSSTPSMSKKRPCTSQDSDLQPLKKVYYTRSMERVVSKASDWADVPDLPPCKPSSEATHVPVAARTRTGPRGLRQRKIAGQGNSVTGNTPVGPISKIEVVIFTKSSSGARAAASEGDDKPLSRRTRHSLILPRKNPKFSRRRQSAPAPVTRRAPAISYLQDDNSDDELSFL